MDKMIANVGKDVLAMLVKAAQQQGMEGSEGDWEVFLSKHDKLFGSRIRDLRKKSAVTLARFLKTFSRDDDVKMLVRLTFEHPQYPLDYSFPSHEEGWLRMKLSTNQIKKFPKMLAVDSEMVLCEDGTEALVRVCVVGRDLQVKLNELVNPNKAVADYRSEITGLGAEDLDGVTCSLANVQPNKKARGKKYSAFANFKNQEEANQAFENIDGYREKAFPG